MTISFFCQLILGLWNFSYVNPRIRFYLSKLKTAKRVHFIYVLYQRTILTTFDISSILFVILSILYTGIEKNSL